MKRTIIKFIFGPATGETMIKTVQNHAARAKNVFLVFTLLIASLGIITFSGYAADVSMKTLPGHVPSVVSNLKSESALSSDTNLNLAIGLPLRNQQELNSLLQQVYDPASTNYHHYLTPEQFTAEFGPTEQDYQSIKDFAKANGFKVTKEYGNRMLLDVQGRVGDIEKAFNITLRLYHHPTENRDFFAPDSEPTVSSSLPVLHVEGLNNYILPHPMLHKKSAVAGAQPGAGSGPGGGYMGSDFRNAYIPGSALNGSGQTVGLFQFDGYLASDIQTYEGLAGLTNVPLANVLLDGFNGSAGPNNDEVCLDIEMSISMAPALSQVVVFEAGPYGFADDILNAMAASNQIKQLSASWGYDVDLTTEQIYQQLALQGQTFLNASGDGDAWVGGVSYSCLDDPYITLVGGTTLTTSNPNGSYASETVWNWGPVGDYNWNPDGYAGTSGGISTTRTIPTWQQGINMSTNHGSTTMRNMPDVALTADNIFVVSSGGQEGIFGGTSCASPLWAGFMALANQQAASLANTPPVGFLAPIVYALAKTTNYTSYFHDITTGNNTWPGSPTNFYGVPGYDLCTGWGTPNGTNIINALTGLTNLVVVNTITHLSAPPPPYGSTLGALDGSNPNGNWELFIEDIAQLNSGVISNGWVVHLTTANPVGYSANLELTMTPSATNIFLSNDVAFTLGVTNYGPSVSSNVVVSDSLSSGVTLLSVSTTQGSVNGLNWNVGNLNTNAGAQMTVTVQADSLGTIENDAVASADTPDPNAADNSADVTVNVGTATPPVLTTSLVSPGVFEFTLTGTPGSSYTILVNTNLSCTSCWVPILTTNVPGSGQLQITEPGTTNSPDRYYWVVPGL
jgi:uncharacterized repeat protein (TIGR01451 family)